MFDNVLHSAIVNVMKIICREKVCGKMRERFVIAVSQSQSLAQTYCGMLNVIGINDKEFYFEYIIVSNNYTLETLE